MVPGAVLIVASDPTIARLLPPMLGGHGIGAQVVASVALALAEVDRELFDVIVLDGDVDGGSSALADIVKRFGEIPVVVAASGGAKRAVEAIRAGAADFVEKPFQEAELVYVIQKVVASSTAALPPDPAPLPPSSLLGSSKAMQHVLDIVQRVSPTNATVLVRGESGTGKELVARAIHHESPRAQEPFVKVHCAGLPESLLESELFGYERGAFTGAMSRKPGRVEVAEGGTLFFDEIGDITPAVQVKLLRLLQDRQYERLGASTTLRADVRFIAATHRDLEHMIKKGAFREDLFYRLNVVPVWLPPLRARRGDVALLAGHFCEVFSQAHAKPGTTLTDEAIAELSTERWPGNIRQLQNFVERLVVLSQTKTIEREDVRREMAPPLTFGTHAATGATSMSATPDTIGGKVTPLDATMREAERRAIEKALRHAKGNRTLAARLLGIGRATLYTKIEELGLGQRQQ